MEASDGVGALRSASTGGRSEGTEVGAAALLRRQIGGSTVG